jgi:DNA-binding response OmpR family regulator
MTESAHILVIDDEPDTLSLIELTLKTAGYRARLSSSGKEGLQLARQETFDLILLDIMMPDMSGFDVLTELKKDPQPHPPVIILTAKNRQEDREMGMNLGAFSYLVKPITRSKLLDMIGEALGEPVDTDVPH